jgi:hypothetical protein
VQAVDQQPPAVQAESGPAAKAGGGAEGTVAQLQSELSLVRQEKAQAEEAARVARTDAEIARRAMEEATNAANAAAAQIDRLKQVGGGPSSIFERSNVAPIGAGAVTILILGLWLGSRASRWRARQPANNVNVGTKQVEAISPPSAKDQVQTGIDQDGLVRDLGKQLGLEEATAPVPATPVPEKSVEPAPQQEHAAPPLAAALPSEEPASPAGVSADAPR